MNEAAQTVEALRKILETYGIIGGSILVLLCIAIFFLFRYQLKKVEEHVRKGTEEILKEYQKALDLRFSEDAVKNALKIEIGKKSIEKKLETWEALFDLIQSNAQLLENARVEGRLGELSLYVTDPPFREFDTLLASNDIYLGKELAEKFRSVSNEVETRVTSYVRCFLNLTPQGFPSEHNQAILADQNKNVREALEDLKTWLQKNLYTIINISDIEQNIAAELKILNGPKSDESIS